MVPIVLRCSRVVLRSFVHVGSLALLVGAASTLGGCGADAHGTEPKVFARTAVLGASASAGYGLIAEAGHEVVLADVLQAAAPGTFTSILDASTWAFFMAPERKLDEAIAKAEATAPELVIGVDVLFWFAYGDRPDGERVAFLERGIARLEGLAERTGAQLLVGDFPDVRDASWLVMPPSFKPGDAALADLQAALAAWDARRDDVEIVALSAFVEALRAGSPVTAFGRTIETTDRARFMQNDDLHPTLEGTAALALMVLQVLERTTPLGDAIRSDPAEVARVLREAQGAAR